jgi:CRP-like cAMP-binding protein
MDKSQVGSQDNPKYQTLFDLFRSGLTKTYPKGYDFSPDHITASQSLHLIGYGYIKAFTTDNEGNERVLIVYGRGDMFPVLPLVNPNSRDIFYRALTSVKLHSVASNLAMDGIFNNLALSNAMIEKLLFQVTCLADLLENLAYMKANERLVYRLVILGARFGQKRGDQIRLDKLFTHNLIGSTINLTRETVSREFEQLMHKGLVDSINHEIVINDISRLHEELGNPISQYLWRLLEAKTDSNKFNR